MARASARAKVRTRIGIGLAAAVAASSLIATGCGGSAASAGAGASDLAAFAPANSPLYFEVSTDADGTQWTQLRALAKRFPGYPDTVRKIDRSLTENGVDFETQIKPLLGAGAAVAVFDFKGLSDSANPSFMIAIDIADGKESDALKLLQSGKHAATKIGQHDGVDVYGKADDGVFAVTDGTLVFADTQKVLERVLDAHRAGGSQTLADSSKLDDVFAELPDEVLAQGFIDVGAFLRIAESGPNGADVAKQLDQLGLGNDAAVGVSVAAEPDGIRLKGVGLNLGKVTAGSQPFTPKLTERVPADAIAYIGLSNAYGAVQRGIVQVQAANPEVKKSLSQAALALPLLGVNLDDIKGLTSLEHAFVVTKGAEMPGFVAALEVADPARAAKVLDTLRGTVPSLLEKAGSKIPPFTQVPLAHGITGWQSPISPKAGIVYGVDGQLALLGTLPDALKQVQAPAHPLAADPAYLAATRQMPSKVDAVAWINGESLMSTLNGLGLLKSASPETIANLKPLKSLAAWTTGGDKPTFEAFLTIK